MDELERFLKIRPLILQWFGENKEDYFFRKNRTPYQVWVSEVILQQTRLNSAIIKMKNFLDIFPDVESLANADEDEVLDAFKGLGYYNRARNLQKGAMVLKDNMDFYDGNFEKLVKIPSIGPYTAAAISSICFNKPHAVIDGNIKRIVSRIFAVEGNIGQKSFENKIRGISEYFFYETSENSGEINESLMEFGQKVCTAGAPECKNCFINGFCKAYVEEKVSSFPGTKKVKYKTIHWEVFLFIKDNRIIMQKYKDFPFLKNQTGFPSIIHYVDSGEKKYSTGLLKTIDLSQPGMLKKGPRHNITDNKIQFLYRKITGIDMNEFKESLEKIEFVDINYVEKKLVSSGLLKLWRLSNLTARGGT